MTGTPRLTKLERLAALVAIEAPRALKGNHYAKIRNGLIAEIRTELALKGFDWGQAHHEARQIARERGLTRPGHADPAELPGAAGPEDGAPISSK